MGLFQAYRLKGDEAKTSYAADQLNKFYKAEKATVEQQEVKEQKKPVEKPVAKPDTDLKLPEQLK
jgi:hypothetical protein